MFIKSLATVLLISATTMIASTANAADELYKAMTAAMGEAIEDPRYMDILDKYGLPAPDLENDKSLVNSADYQYPESVEKGTLLDRVLETETLRLGWIAVGAP